MDFREICTSFGGTIFYEEFRGDLKAVGEKIQERAAKDPDQAGSALLLRGILHMMLGDMVKADAFFTTLFDLKISPRWSFRSMVYKMLLEHWRAHPPIFTPRSLVKTVPLMVWWTKGRIRRHFEPRKYCRDNQHDPEALSSNLDSLEYDLILVLYEEMSTVATLAHLRDDGMHKARENTESKLTSLLQRAKDESLLGVAMYIHGLLYDLDHMCQSPQLPERLVAWRTELDQYQSSYAYGLYEMKLGDSLFHSLFSNPFPPNIVAVEPPDYMGSDFAQYNPLFGTGNQQPTPAQDADEAPASFDLSEELIRLSKEANGPNRASYLKQRDSLLQAYNRAESRFIESGPGAERAIASVLVRKSAIYAVETLRPAHFYGSSADERKSEERKLEERAQAARLVLQHLKKAAESFLKCGDCQGNDLASICSLMIRSGSVDEKEMVEVPRSTGLRLTEEGNDGLALHLGLLAMRVANRFRYLCGEPAVSCRAFEHARRILQTNIFPTALIQSMLASASGMITLCNYAAARLWYRYLDQAIHGTALLKNILDGASVDLRSTVSREPDPHSELAVDNTQRLRFCTSLVMMLVDTFLADEKLFNSFDQPSRLVDTKHLFSIVEAYSQFSDEATAAAQEWIGRCNRRIQRLENILHNEQLQAISNMETANIAGNVILDDPDHRQATEFDSKSDLVELAMRVGKTDLAAEILDQIKDPEQVPAHYNWIPYSSVSRHLENYRVLVSSWERLLRLCLLVGSWPRATTAMAKLQELSPDYFGSPGGYTALSFWQRCLYASLVHAGLGDVSKERLFLVQSALVYAGVLGDISLDPTTRKQAQNHPDALCLRDTLVGHLVSCGEAIPEDSRPFISHDDQLWKDFGLLEHTTETTRINVWNEALQILETGRSQFMQRYQLHLPQPTTNSPERIELAQLEKELPQIQASLMHYKEGERSDMSSGLSSSIDALYDEYLLPMTFNWIIPENVLVIYLVTSERGLTSFAIANGGIKYAHRNNAATGFYVRELVSNLLANVRQDVDENDEEAEAPPLNKELNRELSELLIGGMETYIKEKSGIIFIPSGALSRLPFGALLFQDEYLILSKSVSVAPTLYCLTNLYMRSANSSVVGERMREFSFLGIPKKFAVDEQPLVMALPEAMIVSATLLTGGPAKSTESYSREKFRDLLKTVDVLHLCTHGEINRDNPFMSTLSLGEKFPVIDLLAVKTDIKLITISACLSGTGHSQYGGDAFGFSPFLLASGARNVIGALWSINDIVALLHMILFYTEMVAAQEATSLADLWRKATIILQKMSRKQCIALLGYMKARLAQVKQWYAEDFMAAEQWRKVEDQIREFEVSDMDMSHPRYWAAFSLFGNADYRFSSASDAPYQAGMRMLLDTMAKRVVGDED